jgi:hypothetical protein
MSCLQQVQSQLGSMWGAFSSQADSFCRATNSTITGWHSGIEFYTIQAAKYVFGQDRSERQRNLVLCNFVVPLCLTAATVAFLVNRTAALGILIISFISILAKRNAV